MAGTNRVDLHRLAALVLVAYASVLAIRREALAQGEVQTFAIKDRHGVVLRSVDSDSGLAVVTTFYQPTKFEILHLSWSGYQYGRIVPDGSPLAFPESLYHGLYLPSRDLTASNWSFGGGANVSASGNDRYGNTAYYPGRGGDELTDQLYYLGSGRTKTELVISGAPISVLFSVQLEDSVDHVPHWPVVNQVDGGGLVAHLDSFGSGGGRKVFWRRNLGGPEIWNCVSMDASTAPPFVGQETFRYMTLEVKPDPFKAMGEGDFDDTGIINAITAQTDMQAGYFSQWNIILLDLHENINGELFGLNWEQRDTLRNNSLVAIEDDVDLIHTDVVNIRQNVSLMYGLLQIIQQAVSTSAPTTGVPAGPPVYDELEATYAADRMGDPLDPEWQMPVGPTASSLSTVWEFTVPTSLAGIGFGNPMPDMVMRVDLSIMDPFLAILHPLVLLLLTVWGAGRIWQEFRRR